MKLLLVDDQVLFVESLRTVLMIIADDLDIVGIANSGLEAIKAVEQDKPDIILMDVRMPGMDGVEASRAILEKYDDIKIMMLTTYDDDEYVQEAIKYGVSGYMLKDVPPEDLVNSIRAVMAGTVQMSPKILERIMKGGRSVQSIIEEDYNKILGKIDNLSKREQEILFLMAEGDDNTEIASKLFIAEQTVKNHVSKIYSKLGVHERITVLKIARKADLGRFFNYLND
ncbi:response regulator transcription factor [Spirochaeta isovalerica]|uniref:DNA-binding NarL/FixJ family response regulator n=1 Tax=Spirochaeta isovalerica TaxID=150 RepID=A0A841R803_9SPIO|nr:response regulator transcription factor [Spirochaeta isovalerica]MBB6478868.1 DNA-binding NarL/FixJ family response regulator [Spirochaeta isovalerica]